MNKSIFKPFLREFFFKLEKNVLKFSKAKKIFFNFFQNMPLSYINLKPDKNPKPDRVKPEPDFEKRQKPDPSPNPTV